MVYIEMNQLTQQHVLLVYNFPLCFTAECRCMPPAARHLYVRPDVTPFPPPKSQLHHFIPLRTPLRGGVPAKAKQHETLLRGLS